MFPWLKIEVMNTKERIQYATAVVMLLSGMVLTFLCFFLNAYDVTDGVLWYTAQCIVYAGSVFGVSLVIRSQLERMKRKGEL